MRVDEAVERCYDMGGTDVHTVIDQTLHIRIQGTLHKQDEIITQAEFDEFCQENGVTLYPDRATDVSLVLAGVTCRLNIYWERGRRGIAIRLLSNKIPELDDQHLPDQFRHFLGEKNGMILVTGTVGSGKTTALTALLNEINKTRKCVILTVEDPIEYKHPNKEALFIQREVGSDVPSYHAAIMDALRQDINVVLVGEMREMDTIEAALTLAETGHLVLGTVHTKTLPEAIERMAGAWPTEARDLIVGRIASVFKGGLHMRLLKTIDGGRVAFPHVMVVDNKIRNAIEQRKYSTVEDLMVADPHCYSDVESATDLIKGGRVKPMDVLGFLSKDNQEYVCQRCNLDYDELVAQHEEELRNLGK